MGEGWGDPSGKAVAVQGRAGKAPTGALMILIGDCVESMRGLPDQSVHTCVTSPPYFGLRDYGHEGQIGLEPTPDQFVGKLIEVFREVKRVLRDDGTLWLNLGDSYASYRDGKATPDTTRGDDTGTLVPKGAAKNRMASTFAGSSIKHKDLIGIPWRVAFALQADGWYLRQDIIWHKPNPMPESVTDRCTKAHEYIFLLSKSERYYFDADAIKVSAKSKSEGIRFGGAKYGDNDDPKFATKSGNVSKEYELANRRSVWTVTTKPFKGAHFATFPPDLIEPCVKAGCPEGGTVLDPFGGSGTTGLVAQTWGRKFILCELNPEYAQMARDRIAAARDLFSL
jgi:site-specific DNA-methyltransferase (adenine-specific)